MGKLQWTCQNYKGLYKTTVSNYIPIKWTTQKNAHILRECNLQTNPGRNKNMNRPITRTEIETVIKNLQHSLKKKKKKNCNKQKSRARWLHR